MNTGPTREERREQYCTYIREVCAKHDFAETRPHFTITTIERKRCTQAEIDRLFGPRVDLNLP